MRKAREMLKGEHIFVHEIIVVARGKKLSAL
jgi:hypothetical protein